MRVYFDNAATTPIAPEVVEVMTDALKNLYGNPSSIHADGRMARMAIEDARKTIANSIHASIGEIFFTSGGTESNNMILKNAVRDLGVRRIITSPIEHHCVLHTLESLQKTSDLIVKFVKIDEKGRIDLKNLDELLRGGNEKTLVSLMHANNEIGTMVDLHAVATLCETHKALFHSDTVQTMGYFPIDVSKTKIHFLTGAAHKFHGPKGVGFAFINSDTMIKPFIDGGSQERNMRGGTENVAGIVGMAKALEIAYQDIESRVYKISSLRNYFKNNLSEIFEDIQFIENVEGSHHYKVLNVSFPHSPKSDLLLFNLDIAGISASGGSACSSGAEGGSHVLDALGIDPSRKFIRFSFSHYNTQEEADYVIDKLKKVVKQWKVMDNG
jgi:cysteine desulfurase